MLGMIKFCLCGLKRQRGRTVLVALSIAIGVFSVLIISVISDNGVELINNELDTLGICGVSISKTSVENDEMLTNEEHICDLVLNNFSVNVREKEMDLKEFQEHTNNSFCALKVCIEDTDFEGKNG